jgi:hypothetical protein
MHARLALPLAAALAAGSLAAAGCGDDAEPSPAAEKPAAMTMTHRHDAGGSGPTNTGAAELRAGLTALLQEHVYLAGTAVSTGLAQGLDSKAFGAAAGTLDRNSEDLSAAIGSVYGDAAGKRFLGLWRAHIGFFVNYAKAKASGDAAGARAARRDLDGYREQFGAFLASANPNLTQAAVAAELRPHVQTLFAAIDAAAAKDPAVTMKLRAAASHMPHTADTLAAAIVKQYPERFRG